jgi:hypothetical protein
VLRVHTLKAMVHVFRGEEGSLLKPLFNARKQDLISQWFSPNPYCISGCSNGGNRGSNDVSEVHLSFTYYIVATYMYPAIIL